MNPFGYIKAAALSDVGRNRKNNEDSFGAFPSIGVWCVADGMGGGDDGEVASAAVVREIEGFASKFAFPSGGAYSADDLARGIADAVDAASAWIFDRTKELRLSSCGSTVVGVVLDAVSPGKAVAFHAGDSRLYRIRGKKIKQITTDHSAAELIGAKDESKVNPMFRGMVLRAVGVRRNVDVELTDFDVKRGDRILICSDGLSRMVPDRELMKILSAETECEKAVAAMVAAANEAGGVDNITAILLDVGDLPEAMAKIPFPFDRVVPNTASTGIGTEDSVTQDTGEVTRMTNCPDDIVFGEAESQTHDQADEPDRRGRGARRMWYWVLGGALVALLTASLVAVFLVCSAADTSVEKEVASEDAVTVPESNAAQRVERKIASSVPRAIEPASFTQSVSNADSRMKMKPVAVPALGKELQSISSETGKTQKVNGQTSVLPQVSNVLTAPVASASMKQKPVYPEIEALAAVCGKEHLSAFVAYVRRRIEKDSARFDFSEQMKRASASAQSVVRFKDMKSVSRFMVDFKYVLQSIGDSEKFVRGDKPLSAAWSEVADGDVETLSAVRAAVKVIGEMSGALK